MNFEELVKRLIADGKGDTARLEHILSTLQRGVSLYTSDQEYVEKLLEEEGFILKYRFPQYEGFTGLSAKSRAIKSGTDPYQSKQIFSDKFFGLIAKLMIHVNRRHSEFVTVQFVKSDIKKINS